ncbi:hypothetical protein BOX37_06050 [Nocardia mangyaensis]|uniref:Uncharacterized protein n=1 Tax=Nocardia mangyaensis TaxID=2213200 RepID=A0A1J0VNI2_9NOCA|nr:hypothetical protein BOX37_06050 [Nocardia mangyaensis]
MVVAASGDRAAVPVPQELLCWIGAALLVFEHAGHQGGRDRLPVDRSAFAEQPDKALFGIEVFAAKS